jgi:hypothetical protein
MIGQVSALFANAGRGQVDQQLSEIELGIDIMAAAGAGQAGEDCRRSSSARVSDEEGILAVENDALHLALGDVVVDGHGAIVAEDVQFVPLVQCTGSPQTWGAWAAVVPSRQAFASGTGSAAVPLAPGVFGDAQLAEPGLRSVLALSHRLSRWPPPA